MKKLRIHYLQHVPFENTGCIEDWALEKMHALSCTRFYENTRLPDQPEFDWLIIMGGPMGVYENERYPWMKEEMQFIQESVENNKTVIGICLGAQLIAAALGARVYPGKVKEIGWYPISLQQDLSFKNPLFNNDNKLLVFHWHGDTFDLPANAIRLASSEGCLNQAFIYGQHVIGLQFHFEVTEDSLRKMVAAGKNELQEGAYIQTEQMILDGRSFIPQNNQRMFELLNHLEESHRHR